MISRKDIFTIPNFLSLLRLGLVPVYTSIYLRSQSKEDFALAAGILAISCMTDLLDGLIARRYHMVSDLGKFLDPLADKITQLALMLCLPVRYPLVKALIPLFLAKELTQCGLAYFHFKRGKVLSGALWTGKISTAFLFTSFLVLMFLPALPFCFLTGLVLGDAILMILALGSYLVAFYGNSGKLCDT